jgi:hypothetical protein
MSEITVYWASPNGKDLIQEPEKVFKSIAEKKSKFDRDPKSDVFGCPATRNFYKNLYVFRSNVSDVCVWPEGYLSQLVENARSTMNGCNCPVPHDHKNKNDSSSQPVLKKFGNVRNFSQNRQANLDGYIDLSYHINWIMFASESLKVHYTAPFAPNFSPIDGAIFTNGEYDIGRWFRPGSLQWFVPVNAKKFHLRKGDPLFYFRPLTDKKIIFKQFAITDKLYECANEYMGSPEKHGVNKSLEERYDMLEKEGLRQRVLDEIQKNLI